MCVNTEEGDVHVLQAAGDRRGSLDFEPRFLRHYLRAAHEGGRRLQKAFCGSAARKCIYMIQWISPGQCVRASRTRRPE